MFFKSLKKTIPAITNKESIIFTSGFDALKQLFIKSGTKLYINNLSESVTYALNGHRTTVMLDADHIDQLNVLNSYKNLYFPLTILLEKSRDEFALDLKSINHYFCFYPTNAQDLLDFALITQHASENALIPGLIVVDKSFCLSAISEITIPAKKEIEAYVGLVNDIIDTINEGQKILFGKNRKRIPKMIDSDKPIGLGLKYENKNFLKSRVSQRAFIRNHLEPSLNSAIELYNKTFGRNHAAIQNNFVNNAEYVIAARGAIINHLLRFADYAHKQLNKQIGVLNLTLAVPENFSKITHYVKKKKALTILQDITDPLQNDLESALKNAFFNSWENGRNNSNKLIYPTFAVYNKPKDQPELFKGIYSGITASLEEIYAVFLNMTNSAKRHYFIGPDFNINQSRFPKLQALQQKLLQAYPEIDQLTLPEKELPKVDRQSNTMKLELFTTFAQDISDISPVLAKTLSNKGKISLTLLDEKKAQLLPFQKLSLSISSKQNKIDYFQKATYQVYAHPEFVSELAHISNDGCAIFNSKMESERFWQSQSEETRQFIRSKKINVYLINSDVIADGITVTPADYEHLKLWVLCGALFSIYSPKLDREKITANISALLKNNGLYKSQIENICSAIEKGFSEIEELNWNNFPEFTGLKKPESEAPWAVEQITETDGSLFDLARSWDSVGYLHRINKDAQALNDPFIASNTLPARSSVFRDFTMFSDTIPQIVSEKCTGCGTCWLQCPDSALPVHIASVDNIIKTAIESAGSKGSKLIQVQRIKDNLAKQAYKLFSQDELNQFLTVGDLLSEAFKHLVIKMGLKEDQRIKLEDEFHILAGEIRYYPLIKTDTFFSKMDSAQKGNGYPITINVNPASCKACSSCANVCPENAIEMVTKKDDLLSIYRDNFNFSLKLPQINTSILDTIKDQTDAAANALISYKNYFTMPGGDNAYPGSGVKSVIHIMLSTFEDVMNRRYAEFVNTLTELIQKLEEKIQGRLQTSVQINEFEEFGKKLGQLDENDITPQALLNLIESDDNDKKLDTRRIKRLVEVNDHLRMAKKNYLKGITGNGRSRFGLVIDSKGLLSWTNIYPFNPFSQPWIKSSVSHIAEEAIGLFDGLAQSSAEIFKWCRIAELEINDDFKANEHEAFFAEFGWNDLNATEQRLCPPVIALLDTEAIGQQHISSLLKLLATKKSIFIAAINNGLTEFTQNDNIALWALSNSDSFALQSSAADTGHLISGIMEMLNSDGPGLVHLYGCEPHLQGMPDDVAFEHAKRALNYRVFPLFKYNPKQSDYYSECFSIQNNPKIEDDWVLKNNDSKEFLTYAHWAVHERKFRYEFSDIPKSEWHDRMIPLSQFILLDEKESQIKLPYITVWDTKQKEHRLGLSTKIIESTKAHFYNWHVLQELAGIRIKDREYQKNQWQTKIESELSKQKAELESQYNDELSHIKNEHWQIYHSRLRSKLEALYKHRTAINSTDKTLADYVDGKTNKEKQS